MSINDNGSKDHDEYLTKILELVKGIKYGSVTIIVQDGKIVQVDKTEKFRF